MEGYFNDLKKILIKKQEKKNPSRSRFLLRRVVGGGGLRKDIGEFVVI